MHEFGVRLLFAHANTLLHPFDRTNIMHTITRITVDQEYNKGCLNHTRNCRSERIFLFPRV